MAALNAYATPSPGPAAQHLGRMPLRAPTWWIKLTVLQRTFLGAALGTGVIGRIFLVPHTEDAEAPAL